MSRQFCYESLSPALVQKLYRRPILVDEGIPFSFLFCAHSDIVSERTLLLILPRPFRLMAKGNKRQVVITSTPPPMEDSESRYFLHNGDHPGLGLISHQLIGSNYNTWSRAMVMAITAKNKLGFIDGSVPRPLSDNLLFSVWTRCNSMVISWIPNVSGEMVDSLC